MPLSKERNKERMRALRACVQPKYEPLPNSPDGRYHPAGGQLDRTPNSVQPNFNLVKTPVKPSVNPKLPWYAGASDHFGEVKSQYYAKQFFS